MKTSVVIPIHPPHIKYLSRALANLSNQTINPDEVIIAMSEYNTNISQQLQTILNATKHTYNAVILPSTTKQNASQNRNRGAKAVTGDIVLFIDADDITHIQKVEIMINEFMTHPDMNLCVHNYHIGANTTKDNQNITNKINDIVLINNEVILKNTPRTGTTNISAGNEYPICHGHTTVRKYVLDKISFNENMGCGEDGDFCRRILYNIGGVYYISEKLMIIRPV